MKSRGRNCLKSGAAYEEQCHNTLKNLIIHGEVPQVADIATSKKGTDISITLSGKIIGFEAKNKNAFEGGSKKLEYLEDGTLGIKNDCIHKHVLQNKVIYHTSEKFPYYFNLKQLDDWKRVESTFKPDVYFDIPSDTISGYYRSVGTHYIQIQNRGLFHTGEDVLNIGVPLFTCECKVRIRTSKHIKNKIPTDITAAFQFNKKTLPQTPFSLDGVLPAFMQVRL
jgi:hypothetical protein